MQTWLKGLALAGLLVSAVALAMDIDSAKQNGLVGEQMDGYLGVVVDSTEVRELVADINAKRRSKYQELANANGITLAQVEALAAKKAYSKTEPGHYVQVDGKWVKK
ncbi:YdbL family protein [Aestuariibacter halophilus]|uniref:YdbL family protein n=1 Tax=Fluctibacter halophilus TaxID=226011 RepID=A0ABS8G473_9ALTE|nr:YdbL family protein [Aestuariibacter halophilus]MCC2615392.1 YdbL family protein [Aestuariibacter halophilus]